MKDERYGLALMRTARYMTRVYNRHLAGISLTISQHGILEAVGGRGPIAHQDLADTLVIERSALQRSLQPLIRAGFIESTKDPEQKKRLLYRLTEDGAGRLQSATACVSAAEAELDQLLVRSDFSIHACATLPAFKSLVENVDEEMAAE
ncbi:MarR family winged helix-turn-helix transcriptional regulator [Caballeronia insecticola]|nr:MarR family transcriptional regulator [Caballeronia insecticola]